MPVGQLRLQVPASMTKPIGVRLADKEEKSFVADYVDPSSKMRTMILVVWGSKRPLPTSGQKIDVVGKPIPLTEVDITAPVGDLHEKVGAIFYVEKQIIAE